MDWKLGIREKKELKWDKSCIKTVGKLTLPNQLENLVLDSV